MPLTPSPSNVSNPPAWNVNIIHPEANSSDSNEQDDQEQNVFEEHTSQDSFSPLEFDDNREVDHENLYFDEYEENVLAEVNVIEETNRGVKIPLSMILKKTMQQKSLFLNKTLLVPHLKFRLLMKI